MEVLIEEFLKTKHGSGYGYGDGYGSGYGSGDGSGSGYEDGSGYGDDSGDGDVIVSINGKKVYKIDGVQTIITSVRNDIAKGYILQSDFTLTTCFIVKENDKFSHGSTLHEAFESLQEKIYDDSSEEERINKFKEHFPDFNKVYPVSDLFVWHHILTGSCKSGRESFAKDNGINIEKDSMTIYKFIELTKNSYNGNIIKKILI